MNRLALGWQLATHLGVPWLAFRAGYAIRRRSGRLARATPAGPWPEVAPGDFAPLRRWQPPASVGDDAVRGAESILLGRFQLFDHHAVDVGVFPEWHRNYLTGQLAPAARHWTQLGDFAFGDIKGVWELSRFGWAFALARAYAATREERFAGGFWRLLADWMERNPPNRGPNWMCGQETTFRVVAGVFAAEVVAASPASTPTGATLLARLLVASGARIEANLGYALSQSNNHGVSEAVGLMTIGLMTRTRDGQRWFDRGQRALRAQLKRLVYPDGAFAQHSLVYHRVLLDDLVWCVARLRAASRDIPAWLLDAGRRALEFLDPMVARETGQAPLYGASDGSRVLPLADGGYRDFRPTLQAGFAALHGCRRLPPGPWDEAAQWLAGESWERRECTVAAADRRHAREGGCLTWRTDGMNLFFRCPTRFRHRPAQADLLHVDLRWRGQPVALDAGTYSYNPAPGVPAKFEHAAQHNTVTFAGAEPMHKASRFLYLPWPRGSADWSADGSVFHASHDGWNRLGVEHTRGVALVPGDRALITDIIRARRPVRARVHWLLADGPHTFEPAAQRLIVRLAGATVTVEWDAPASVASLIRADPASERGWSAGHYSSREPALSLAIEFDVATHVQAVTRFEVTT